MRTGTKVLIILISLVVLGVGGFFGYKYYQTESTRFITALDSKNFVSGASVKKVFTTVLFNRKWKQYKVSGNKYKVECNADFDMSKIKIVIDCTDKGKRCKPYINSNYKVYKNGKAVNSDYALSIITLNYYDLTGDKMPENYKKVHDFLKLFELLDDNFDAKNIDEEYIKSYLLNKDTAKKNAISCVNKLKSDDDFIDEMSSLFPDEKLSDQQKQALRHLSEKDTNQLIDKMQNGFLEIQKGLKPIINSKK